GVVTDNGDYPYTITVTEHNGGGADIVHTYSGSYTAIGRTNSPFGRGWWLDGVDRLVPGATGGPVVALPDGRQIQYTVSGSNYVAPPGEFSTLVHTNGETWTRTLRDGTQH